jgi:hypothetical protein
VDLALYTTIHPGTRPFLEAWHRSFQSQTDTDVSLWIGIDEMTVREACSIMGVRSDWAHWIRAHKDDSPAQVRERAWRSLIPHADAVVLTDADDLLLPNRVSQARRALEEHDVSGCALRLVDSEGNDLGMTMPPEQYAHPTSALPSHNIYGLSNAAYRTELLEECLPLPDDVVMIDWFLATQAWLRGASLSFSRTAQMKYRRHEENTLPLLPPFELEGIRRATTVVQNHFRLVLKTLPPEAPDDRQSALKQAARRVQAFARCAFNDVRWLRRYTDRLNQLNPSPLWWSCVAHPNLAPLCTQSSPP